MGCTKIVKVYPETNNNKIIEVGLSSGIKGIALSHYEVINFDSLGGKFDPKTKIISGVDISGAPIEVKLNDIKEVIHADNSTLIKFDKNLGSFDADINLITGTTSDGDYIELPLKDVFYIKTKKLNLLATSIVIGLPVIFIIVMLNNPGIGLEGPILGEGSF
jgi:hypothetical protein